jgi:hypothetical protein
MTLTEKEILDVACKHCEFTAEGAYHLRKFQGWAIVAVVRECFELANLVRQAEAAPGLTLDASEVRFLAARLRRLFQRFNFPLPDGAQDDARLIGIAGSAIGLMLTNAAGVAIPEGGDDGSR